MKEFSMIFLGIVILIFTACEFEGNSLVINMNYEKKANQIVNELISSIENKDLYKYSSCLSASWGRAQERTCCGFRSI